MTVREILEDLQYTLLQGTVDRDVTELVYDSRKAVENGLFVCISGAVRD